MNVFFIGIIVVAVIIGVFYNQKNTSSNTVVTVDVDSAFNLVKDQLPTLTKEQEGLVKSWISKWLLAGNQGTPPVDEIKKLLGL